MRGYFATEAMDGNSGLSGDRESRLRISTPAVRFASPCRESQDERIAPSSPLGHLATRSPMAEITDRDPGAKLTQVRLSAASGRLAWLSSWQRKGARAAGVRRLQRHSMNRAQPTSPTRLPRKDPQKHSVQLPIRGISAETATSGLAGSGHHEANRAHH